MKYYYTLHFVSNDHGKKVEYVLSNTVNKTCESLFGYGGVWSKDNRKAKRFATIQEVENEINSMCPCADIGDGVIDIHWTRFTIKRNDGRWQKKIAKCN